MAANGISTLATKQLKQEAKLNLASADRTAAGRSDVLDTTLLPTRYVGDIVFNNPNIGGLQLGRPWRTDFSFTDYAPSTELASYVLDVENDIFNSQTGFNYDDCVVHVQTTPTVCRLADGNLGWSAHNGIPVSDDFSDGAWAKGDATCDVNTFIEDATTASHKISDTVTGFSPQIEHTLEVEFKASGRDFVQIFINEQGAFGNRSEGLFDLTDGTNSAQDTGNSTGAVTSTTALVDGWFLCTLTGVPGTTGTDTAVQMYLRDAYTFDTGTYVGDGVSGVEIRNSRIYRSDLGGMQDNPDLDVASSPSYVPTTSGAVYKRAINYDISNNREGVIIEPARTNTMTQSRDMETGYSNANSTTTNGQATGADGMLSMARLIDDSSTGRKTIQHALFSHTVSSGTNCYSYLVKADGVDWVTLETDGYDASANGKSRFDLLNGVVGTKDGQHDTSGILNFGNGIYLIWVTYTTTSDLTGSLVIRAIESDADDLATADGTSSIFISDPQNELGGFPTSRIPTKGSTVVRDVVDTSIPKANVGTDGQLTEGTWVIKVTGVHAVSNGNILDADVGGIVMYQTGGSALIATNNASTNISKGATYTGAETHKFAVAFEDGVGRSITGNGLTAATDANNYLSTLPATFHILQSSSQTDMPGGILQYLIFIPQRETDAVIEDITDAGTEYPS